MGRVFMSGIVPQLKSPSNLPPIGTKLEDMTWAQIRLISDSNLASDYFSIGDTKSIIVNGTIGTISVNATYYVYIIGINHNGATKAIDFGTFKDASGKDICLIDGKYTNGSTDGTKYFNINHNTYLNNGGWKGCNLRYDILGSTDINGADASENTAINPVSNTLMAALPADLRAVMKPMTIYTDNTAGGSNTASYVTTSIDYLPLLAEWEIFNARTFSNSAEQNYQKQYEYYKNGNSVTKYQHSATDSKASWWERSPNVNMNEAWQLVDSSGVASNSSVQSIYGIAPIFRV